MMQISRKQLEEMRQIANRLIDWIDSVDDTPVEVSPEISAMVQKAVENRICLACGQKALDTEQMRRGQDSACYATTRSRIRRGLVTERQLIQEGRLTAENASSGRPAKQDLPADERARRVAEDLVKYNTKQQKRKKSDG